MTIKPPSRVYPPSCWNLGTHDFVDFGFMTCNLMRFTVLALRSSCCRDCLTTN